MKKVVALLLALIMIFSFLVACGKKGDNSKGNTNGGNSSSNSNGEGNVSQATNELGITRYPAESGKNNYTAPEGNTIWTLDPDSVHPSADATAKMACTAAPSSLCVLTNLGSIYPQMPISIFYDSLLYWDSISNQLVPGLATEWEWIDDVTIRFKLREDVYSHLGDQFTASDVVFTINWGCEQANLNSTWAAVFDVENTKVVDKFTVDLAFKDITPFGAHDMARTMAYPMVVEASVEKLGGKEEAAKSSAMGTGPYKLTKWDETNQVIYAERNEDYWAALPYYKYFELHTVTDSTARCMGVEAGDFDFAQSPAANAVLAVIDNPDIATYATGGSQSMRWDFNTDREPLNIKEVRQALSLAVNYDAIKQVIYQGYSDPADSVIPYSLAWHTSPEEGEEYYCYYDIELAKQKLVEAGYADGFELSIMFTSGLSDLSQAVEILQNGLRQIGVDVTLEQFESATFNDRRNNHDYMTMLANPLGTSPASTLKQIDPRIQKWTGSAWLEGNEEEIYDLIDKCKFTADLEKCYEYLDEFQDLYRELCPSVVLACQKNYNMINGDIVNIAYDFVGNVYPSSAFTAEYITG